jgi:hypothetical protein
MRHEYAAPTLGRVLVVVAWLAAGIVVPSCSSPASPSPNPGTGSNNNPTPGPAAAPVLSVAIVDLSTVRRFIPFGAELSPGRLNPAYEFVVSGTTTEVRAATAGTVTRVEPQEQGDHELHVQPADTSYLIIYDHVLDVAVSVGQSLQPGTRIGRVGPWNASQGRVELQINRNNLSVCPRDLGTTEFNATHDAAFAGVDPAQKQPGWTSVCLAATVTP